MDTDGMMMTSAVVGKGGETGMSATEKVINDLNVAKLMLCNPQMLNPEMCVRIGQAINSAIDLLTEQRAHILTIDHLEDALDTVVWLETPVSENLADGYSLIMAYSHKCGCMIFDSPFGDNPSQDRLEYSEYGKSWRCWNKRPTDEQRQEVKWK